MVKGRRGGVIAFSSHLPLREKEATLCMDSTGVHPGIQEPEFACKPHPLGAKEIMVECPEALARVVAAISSTHQVFYHQANVDQADSVVRWQVPLLGKKEKQTEPKDSVIYKGFDRMCSVTILE